MEGLIQIVILICLMIIIALLAVDKVNIVKREKSKESQIVLSKAPEIMGKALTKEKEDVIDNYTNNGDFVFKEEVNFATESVSYVSSDGNESNSFDDEDLPYDDDRFGQGVSLNELMKVGNLLQQDSMNEIQEKETVEVMQKIQGTELYGLLENSIGDSSQRIARLLDRNLKNNESLAYDPKDSYEKFNIDDFI